MHIQHRQQIGALQGADFEELLALAWGGGNGIIRTAGDPFFKPEATVPASLSITVAAGYGFINRAVIKGTTSVTLTFPAGVANYNVYHDGSSVTFSLLAVPVPVTSFMIATVAVDGADEATPTDVRAWL